MAEEFETESVKLDFSTLGPSENNKTYPTDEHGCLKIGGVYTGPTPKTISEVEASKKNTSYDISKHGNLIDDSKTYTGPHPLESEVLNQKNSSEHTVDTNGTFKEEGLYTGPVPVEEEISASGKNATGYEIRENGTFKDDAGVYTGPVPNESSEAKSVLKLYEAQEASKEEDYSKLKKWQKNNLRHAGYKYKPKYTVYTNS